MPQNPILKAHLEGMEKVISGLFPKQCCCAFGVTFEDGKPIGTHEEKDCPAPFRVYNGNGSEHLKLLLTTYTESILNAALEAGGEEQKMVGSNWLGEGDYRKENSKRSGYNSCRTSFHSAINEGIKLIK